MTGSNGRPWSQAFLAFQHRDYRWLWANGFLGLMGMLSLWMVQGWLILEITDSYVWVGAAPAINSLGMMPMSMIGGAVADRLDRRLLLMVLQAAGGLLALIVGLLVVTELVQLWHLLVAGVLSSMIGAVNIPARNTFTYDIVGPEALLNANAASFTSWGIARIISPAIGGLLLSSIGAASVYFYISAMYLSSLPLLLAIKSRPSLARRSGPVSVWRDLMDGLSYVFATPVVRALLLLSVLVEMFGFAYFHVMPIFARDVLEVGGAGLGLLGTAAGVGSLVATMAVAALGDFRHKGWLLVLSSLGFGATIIAFSVLSPLQMFSVSLVLIALVGGTGTTYDTLMATMLQTVARNDMRGRIMGLLGLTFGMNSMGGLLAGVGARFIGAPAALSLCGVAVIVYTARIAGIAPRLGGSAQAPLAPEPAAQPASGDGT